MSKRCQNLLLQIYLHFPEIVQHVTLPEGTFSSGGAAYGTNCKVSWCGLVAALLQTAILCAAVLTCISPDGQLDVLVHRLVTLLADTSESKSAESRIFDANLACRKLAVSHPVLLLR